MHHIELMPLVFEQVPVGGDRNFSYLIGDRKNGDAVLVDPVYSPEGMVERARRQSLKVTHILNTHGHGDHINGNSRTKELTGALVVAHESATHPIDIAVLDNDTFQVGDLMLRFIHTPGHAEDHLVILVEEHAIALTGDLLFVGKVGGTSTEEEARKEWESLQRILRELPGQTTIWPGHDYSCRPASTLALEKISNPFICCADFETFLQLKSDWSSFKAEHGLL